MQLQTLKHKHPIDHVIPLSCLFIVSLPTVTIGPQILCTRTAGSRCAAAAPQRTLTASGNLLLTMWRRDREKAEGPGRLLGRRWSPRMKLVTPPETLPMSWTGSTQITSTGGPLLPVDAAIGGRLSI